MGGGGKGGSSQGTQYQTSQVQIPPEVLARYNAVNARAEDVAQTPFQQYGGQFVAPVNPIQQQATNNLYNATYNIQPWTNYASDQLWGGLIHQQPYYDAANSTIGAGLATGNALAGSGLSTIGAGLGAAQPWNMAGAQGFGSAYNSAQPLNQAAISSMGQALGAANPYNTSAGSAYGTALNSASPWNSMAGSGFGAAYNTAQPYQQGATNLAMAGTGQVNPDALNIQGFMSPYNDAVVQRSLGLLDRQQKQEQLGLQDRMIQGGAFGGDRAGVAAANLGLSQDLAYGKLAADLNNQNYAQALGAAQQQQGVYLGAGQANRAALASGAQTLAGIGNQGFNQGLQTAQGYAGLGNQIYGQGLGYAQGMQGLGNQIYNQGLGAANLYGNIGNQMFNQGATAAQGQLAAGQQMFGQGLAAGQGIAGIGNQMFAQGLGAGQAYQGLGQGMFGSQLAASQQFGNLGASNNAQHLATNQALLGAGTVGQQTEQANLSALYNQFLQQQGYPFQVTQFLANIAQGTGALSGSTTSTSAGQFQPQPYFSDPKLKDDVETIGHTKDGIPIIRFRYKGSPNTQIGLSADDVERVRPEAVGRSQGYKTVDYDAATKADGGFVGGNNSDNMRYGFAVGGMPMDMNQLLQMHQAMYPGSMNPRGIGADFSGGTGPRGMQIPASRPASLATAKVPDMRQQSSRSTGLQQDLNAAGNVAGAVKTAKDLYGAGKDAYAAGKDALMGSAEVTDPKTGKVTPASGGLFGRGGEWSPEEGWFGKLGSKGAADSGIAVAELPPIDSEIASWSNYDKGGRVGLAAGGMPYGENSILPEEIYDPEDPQKLAVADAPNLLSKDKDERKSGKGLGSGIGSLVGMGIGSIFGMPGVGGAAGGMLGGLFKDGGRIGKDEGGALSEEELRRLTGLGAATVPFDTPASLPGRTAASDTSLRHEPLLPRDQLPSMPEYEWKSRVRPPDTPPGLPPDQRLPVPSIAPRGAGIGAAEPPPATPPVTVQAQAPPSLGPAISAAGSAPAGIGAAAPPAPTPTAAPSGVAAAQPQPAVPALAPPKDIALPPGFRSPGGVNTAEDYLTRMQAQESRNNHWDPKTGQLTTSPAGATGIMQVMPKTGPEAAKLAGLPWNPELFFRQKTGDPARDQEAIDYNKALGRAYYMEQLKVFGDPAVAAAAYNAGPQAVRVAQARAATVGGNYLDFLPKETQQYVAIVSGQARPGGGPALNVPAPGGGTPSAPPADPGVGLGAAQQKPGFWDKDGWLDRNGERVATSGLAFLGNMLASPSRTLAGSIGSGLAAAAPMFFQQGVRQTGLEQGQQRIGIAETQQMISTWATLRQKITQAKANGLPVDPALEAQVNALEKLVMARTAGVKSEAPSILTGRAGNQAAGMDPAGGGSGTAPATAAAPVASPATPGGPRPGLTGASPAAPSSPTIAPANRQWFEEPRYGFEDPAFLAQIPPDRNPFILRERAKQAAVDDPTGATTAQLNARADQILEQWKSGEATGAGGTSVTVPGATEVKKWKQNSDLNTAWGQTQGEPAQQRQLARASTQSIAKILESYETGRLEDVKADITALSKALGVPVDLGNPAAFQTFMKNALDVTLRQAAAGGAPSSVTDSLREQVASTFATPNLQPKANMEILAKTLGVLNWADQQYHDTTQFVGNYPGADRNRFTSEWLPKNDVNRFINDARRDIAVLGATPDTRGELEPGQAYIITPEKIVQLQGGNIDEVRKQFGGKKSMKARWVNNGKEVGWEPVK